ncbi:uncharacterized protein BP01DRAFT_96384 [Aspergillus saccharolyticus JOP 1030-1]|uniref:Uncharacterized protein n=1 Tax=Aspergillus saccharolyticus JOP 1030-1 TaxID=1450539 RepID=A0A318Z8J2_9EURO|nr:hypothetical protein BP01DRAFT_96384 [Aspergillus saccharolyticus JOP 1030-1]PYH43655.1 hypothetical protein BP01DRAFT_96384 [Aspergillus saccharolyticus JOP 1030-1]
MFWPNKNIAFPIRLASSRRPPFGFTAAFDRQTSSALPRVSLLRMEYLPLHQGLRREESLRMKLLIQASLTRSQPEISQPPSAPRALHGLMQLPPDRARSFNPA